MKSSSNLFGVDRDREMRSFVRSLLCLVCLSLLALPAVADISGTVFRDVDADGVEDAGEPGIFGITVNAFADGAGAPTATATTDVNGDYTLTLGAGDYRIEVGNSSATATFQSGPAGTTRVTFATNGATGVDVGLFNPLQYCQSNPDLVTNCYIDGDQDSTDDVLISLAYTESGESDTATIGHEAQAIQIGTTWGLAHNRTANILFAGSHSKRHAGYGDQDTGTAGVQAGIDATGVIWQIPNPSDGVVNGGADAPQEFVNLNDLFVGNPFGANTHPIPGTDMNTDNASYAAVGKTSIGDMDISDDDLTLWLVNMEARELWEVSLGSDPANPAVPTAGDINTFALDGLFDCEGDGGTSHPDLRPFGVKFHDGRVYVGAVCTTETAGDTDDSGLRALVFRFNPLTDTFDATPAVNFLLTYDRGCLLDNGGTCLGGGGTNTANWQGWEDDFDSASSPRQPNGTIVMSANELGYPQPMLADIEFAPDGTMILGIRDRWGDQLGRNETFPDGTSVGVGDADAVGDILRAQDTDGDGVYVVSTIEATDGTEFFGDDDWTDTVYSHDEVVNGGLAVWAADPGGDVAATVMDPIDGSAFGVNDFSAGLRWFDLAAGTTDQRLEVYDPDNAGPDVFFGKANGLGDLEAICNASPIEVGNRVWNDLDKDGVQDPGEPGINGVTVFLFEDPNGVPNSGDEIAAGSVVTAGDGNFIFTVDAGTTYYVQLAIPAGFRETTLDSVQIGDGNDDARDSDGQTGFVGSAVVAPFTTGGPGGNDHTIDLGFFALEFDWGDLPDGPYATLSASNGANHEITSPGNCFLGTAPDSESDGQPNATATGDDTDLNGDDEDGVAFLTPLTAGSLADIQVTSSAACVLNAWIDFNSDGDFLDANEQIASDLALAAGANLIDNLAVPADATGIMAARFRVTNTTGQGGDSTTGSASTGEVEDYVLASVGDEVWNDINGDGINDDSEPGLSNVLVNLLDGAGNPVLDGNGNAIFTLTDALGNYEFAGLGAGSYRAEFVLPAGTSFSPQNVGDDTTDSDPDTGTGQAPFSLAVGQTDLTIDAGVIQDNLICRVIDFELDALGQPINAGDIVDVDVNDPYAGIGVSFDGFACIGSSYDPGAGECAGGAGDRVQDRLMIFDSTSPTGGDIDLGAPNNTCPGGGPGIGTGGEVGMPGENCAARGNVLIISEDGDSGDPDDNGSGGFMGIDFPFPVFVEGIGLLDAEEADSFTLTAFDSLGNTVNVATSQAFGDNSFQRLSINRAPVSRLEFELPGSGSLSDFTICFPPAALGNRVWVDENSDGVQDAGEPGIPNVTVELWQDTDGDGARDLMVAETVTDADGGYLFDGLEPGTYFVDVLDGTDGTAYTLPEAGMTQTTPSTFTGNDFGNQDHSGANGYLVTVGPNEENLTADFGYNHNPDSDVNGNDNDAAIGDRVWIDVDGDGVQDPQELGLAGVTVDLLCAGADGQFGTGDDSAQSTTTDANGNYIFSVSPAPDVCTVTVTPPANYVQTGDPDDFGQPAGSPDNTTTDPVVLGPGDVFLNADFGYQPTAGNTGNNSVGDTVWLDEDADGIEDGGEQGIPNVSVALIVDTDGDGLWQPAGADGDPTTLADNEPIVATDVTDANGNYLFDGVPDGNYLVTVTDSDNVLGGLVQSGDPDGVLDELGATDLDSAGASAAPVSDLTLDFGYTSVGHNSVLGGVGDTIFWDFDSDGVPDPGEGIEGVFIQIVDNSSGFVIAVTTTDENGNYFVGGLPAGDYDVVVDTTTLPPGLENTVDPDGGLDSQSNVVLTDGEINLDQDFGYELAAAQTAGSIGNLVWLDQNADGTNDGDAGPDGVAATDDDEGCIAGVTVDLYYDVDGDGSVGPAEPLIGSTTTDGTCGGSNYLFANLPTDAGGGSYPYVVDVTDDAHVLFGYWHSLGTAGADNESEVDPDGSVLTPGAPNDLTEDFGYYVEPAALGNRVWVDNDFNGLQDATDLTGIPNVEVTLVIDYPNASSLTIIRTTDGSGAYSFPRLLADEDYNGDGVAPEPTFEISIDQLDPDNVAALAGVGPPTMTDVNDPADDFRDSDDPDGVSAFPTQGITDMTVDAPTPANEADPEGSYDFGFRSLEFDWGDLPDGPYPTLAASSGPSHETTSVGNVYLGGAPDSELNGQPSADGLGDDGDLDGDDEDGVLFLHPLVAGYSADIDVTASAAGFLSAFIDFNSDGDFLDPGETLASDLAIAAGTTTLNIASVPAGATGTMAARFRITNAAGQGGASPTGPASTGEVEDYVLGCIGDFVWRDLDGDGIQDGGSETGVSGATVNLVNPDSPFLPLVDANGVPYSTTTDGGGNYSICGLPTVENSGRANPGEYRILFDLPAGFQDFSPPNTTGDTMDSDADQDAFGTGLEGLAPLPALPPITISSGEDDDTVDAGVRAITAALITSAAAYVDGASVVFEFSTGYEALSAGFAVYRFDSESGAHVEVTERPMTALLGAPQGGVYRIVDEGAPFAEKLEYVVVEHQADGKTRAYGPFVVPLEARGDRRQAQETTAARPHVSKRLEQRLAAARKEAALRGDDGRSSSFADNGKVVRTALVSVRESGLHSVLASELAATLGIPEGKVREAVRSYEMVVENRGQAVAWFPSDTGDALYFYGEAIDSLYTLDNTYWLRFGAPGVPMEAFGGRPAGAQPGGVYRSTERFEEDVMAAINSTLESDVDYWFWDGMNVNSPERIRTFDLAVPDVMAGEATLRVELAGATNGTPYNDHHAIVRVNGVEVGTTAWGGFQRHVATMSFDSSLLTPLTTVEIEGTLEEGSTESIFFIDSFEIDYPRGYQAVAEGLLLTGDDNKTVTVDGLTTADVAIFDLSDPYLPLKVTDVLVEPAGGGFRASFGPANGSTPYLVTTLSAARAVSDLRAYAPAIELTAAHHRFEHVVIAPQAWMSQAAELVAFHESQGMSSLAVSVEEVYNAFSWGNATPWAIRDFLAYARANWSEGPDYAVLAGRGTFDHRDIFGDGDSFLPVVMIGTPYGLVSTDNVLADLVGDDSIPDVAIGRLPIVSPAELTTYVEKLEAYEASSGPWRGRALMLADNADPAGDFPQQSDAVAELLTSYEQQLVYLSELDIDTARAQLQAAWNDGVQLVNYIGHGGVAQLANEGLLLALDMDLLNNGDRLPVVSALTCVVGRSDIPGIESLAEALVTDSDGGAMAVWAPTTVSLSGPAHELNVAYVTTLEAAPPGTLLGDIVLEALRRFGKSGGSVGMLNAYAIAGDPAVQLP